MFSEGGIRRVSPRAHLEATGLVTAGRLPVQVSQPWVTARNKAKVSPRPRPPGDLLHSQSTRNLSPDTNHFRVTDMMVYELLNVDGEYIILGWIVKMVGVLFTEERNVKRCRINAIHYVPV